MVDRTFKADTDAHDAEGYCDTGDLAMLDDAGNLTITGRSKDLIKSGGEWINPGEIEAIVGQSPAVALVAVAAREHAEWGERPILLGETRRGAVVDREDVISARRGHVADWWMPDEVIFVPQMPLAATGTIDKVRLRAVYGAAQG